MTIINPDEFFVRKEFEIFNQLCIREIFSNFIILLYILTSRKFLCTISITITFEEI